MKCSAVGNILGNTLRTGAGGNAVGQTPPFLRHMSKGHVKIIIQTGLGLGGLMAPLFLFLLLILLNCCKRVYFHVLVFVPQQY
jgi:hypothetical protein